MSTHPLSQPQRGTGDSDTSVARPLSPRISRSRLPSEKLTDYQCIRFTGVLERENKSNTAGIRDTGN